jgi:hypothetical protein
MEHHLHRSSLLLLCPDRSLDALQPVNKTLFSEIKLSLQGIIRSMARLDPDDPHALAPASLAHHLDVIEGKFDAVLPTEKIPSGLRPKKSCL